MQNVQRLHASWGTARPRDPFGLVEVLRLQVHQALEERVIVCRVEPRRAAAHADVRVERRRLLNEIEAGNVSKVDVHLATAAASFLPIQRLAVSFASGLTIFPVMLRCLNSIDQRGWSRVRIRSDG